MKKLSIITINYNNKAGLSKTIESVVNQVNADFEYIVIDGGSTDGSIDVIQENSEKIHYYVSEKDFGIYNAMNKGIKAATGTFLLFVNSGDFLVDNTIIATVLKELSDEVSIYYGNVFCSKNGMRTFLWRPPGKISYSYFLNDSLPHAASFMKRSLFHKHFFYDESLKIVSDWGFFVYCIHKGNESYHHLDLNIADFDRSGISSDEKNTKLVIQERTQVLKKHFPIFYEDMWIIKKNHPKLFKQILFIKKNKLRSIKLRRNRLRGNVVFNN